MKKILSLLLCFSLLAVLAACGTSKESPVEDFRYVMQDGEVYITGYIGSDLEIYIPSEINDRPVTTIAEAAFQGYDMTHITIPDSVTKIDGYAFKDCACLNSVEMSDQLKTIEAYAFKGCSALQSVDFPDGLERIEEGAFYNCGLKKVSLPTTLKFLGADSFASCEELASLTIPDETKIDISVFTQNAGYVGYVTFFTSPVGGSHITTYFDNATNEAVGTKEFDQLPTTIVVSSGSYAYQQVRSYTSYGLTIEVK